MITPEQSRAARGLLGWSQEELRKRARMARKTIQEFEIGVRRPYARTLEDLQRTFEAAGIEFIEPIEGMRGRGVVLKWGVDVPSYVDSEGGEASQGSDSGHKALDAELAAYWKARPELWQKLSDAGREVLSNEIYGDPYAAKEYLAGFELGSPPGTA